MAPAAEMPPLPKVPHRQRGWRERSLWRFLMAAIVLVVLHVPFLFVDFKTERPEDIRRPPPPEVVSLPAADAGGAVADFYAWLNLANPAQWYFPDAAAGFAAANRSASRPGLPDSPQFTPAPVALGRFIFGAKRLNPPPVAVAATAVPQWWLRPAATPEAAPSYPAPVHRIIWRLADGRALARPPELDAEGLAAWRAEETRQLLEAGTGVTALEVLLPTTAPGTVSQWRLPRIVLRRSCGVPALDAAAQRALRRHLRGGIGNSSGVSSVQLEVSW